MIVPISLIRSVAWNSSGKSAAAVAAMAERLYARHAPGGDEAVTAVGIWGMRYE